MTEKKTWFITGAKAVGEADDLRVVELDITSREDANAGVA
jgi:hypothetical protein